MPVTAAYAQGHSKMGLLLLLLGNASLTLGDPQAQRTLYSVSHDPWRAGFHIHMTVQVLVLLSSRQQQQAAIVYPSQSMLPPSMQQQQQEDGAMPQDSWAQQFELMRAELAALNQRVDLLTSELSAHVGLAAGK